MSSRQLAKKPLPDKDLPSSPGAGAVVRAQADGRARPRGRAAGPPAQRPLGHPQMAFVRSWAEGLDPGTAWQRYLGTDGAGDALQARRALQALLDQLRGLALAHGRPDIAALLRRDPMAITNSGVEAPSLQAFAAQFPPDHHTEAELIAWHQEKFGRADARSAARRRQRLRARLGQALAWLEQIGVRTPQPADRAAAWLGAPVARRLAAAGIDTLGALHARILDRGFHWHRGIHRLGPAGAARIVRWLGAHAASLGALPTTAVAPRAMLGAPVPSPAPRAGIVPLERFQPPAGCDGAQGSNRGPATACLLQASTDLAAVHGWLQQHRANAHTWRAYRKEAERFLLWAVMERRKALSSLEATDCAAYRDFLAAPGPQWTGPRNTPRTSDHWRPFEAALADRSQTRALTVARLLCNWLVDQRYLASNPWQTPRVPAPAAAPATLRALSPAEWGEVRAWLAEADGQTPSPAQQRLAFILDITCMTGMRLSELAAARLDWLQSAPTPGGGLAWTLWVQGKGGRRRPVALDQRAVDLIRTSLAGRGLSPDAGTHDPQAPLVARLDSGAALSPGRLHEVVVNGLKRCALQVALRDPAAAARIHRASTHWLRHTHGLQAVASGMRRQVLQARLGHAHPASTAVYGRDHLARGAAGWGAALCPPA